MKAGNVKKLTPPRTTKLLLVDEDIDLLKKIASPLEGEFFEFIQQLDPLKVLYDINKELPDIIIIEPRIKNYNGLKILREISSKKSGSEKPYIIVYSSISHQKQFQDAARGLDVFTFLHKIDNSIKDVIITLRGIRYTLYDIKEKESASLTNIKGIANKLPRDYGEDFTNSISIREVRNFTNRLRQISYFRDHIIELFELYNLEENPGPILFKIIFKVSEVVGDFDEKDLNESFLLSVIEKIERVVRVADITVHIENAEFAVCVENCTIGGENSIKHRLDSEFADFEYCLDEHTPIRIFSEIRTAHTLEEFFRH